MHNKLNMQSTEPSLQYYSMYIKAISAITVCTSIPVSKIQFNIIDLIFSNVLYLLYTVQGMGWCINENL